MASSNKKYWGKTKWPLLSTPMRHLSLLILDSRVKNVWPTLILLMSKFSLRFFSKAEEHSMLANKRGLVILFENISARYLANKIAISSAGITRPRSSTITARSPSPSNPTPKRDFLSTTCLERTPRVSALGSEDLLGNAGSTSVHWRVVLYPQAWKTAGAVKLAEPFPQSMITLRGFVKLKFSFIKAR